MYKRFYTSGVAAMTVTTLSSREFNQDTGKAKKAASKGPVFITDRGRPSHVLLTIEAYQRLTGNRATIGDLLSMPGIEDVDFDTPRLPDHPRAADLP
jgi:prevent-host-death family protein